jgi:two-component system cell cycle sensor histidine kinase/response regulator CckA
LPSLLVVAILWPPALLPAQETTPAHPVRAGQPLSERGELSVGMANDSFPYSYAAPDGQVRGFGVDLLNAVARVMNLPVRRISAPSRMIQERFREGEFDLLQALSQTAERQSYATFSVPYLTLQGALFVQKRNSPIRTLADFNGRKFVIIGANSIAEQFLRDHGVTVDPVVVSSTAEALRLVESGECAGVFASQLTTLSVIQRDGFRNIVMFDSPYSNYDIRHCFAVHPGDAELLARLNEGLAILHRTGEFDRIHNAWFGQFTSPVISRERVVSYSAIALAVAFVLTLWGFLHQRSLRKHIAGQAAELAGQQALLRTLYDNIPMGMCVLAAGPGDYRILSINRSAEAWFGLPADQAAGRPLAGVPADPEWMTHFSELLQRGLTVAAPVREERRLAATRKRLIFTLVPMTPDSAGQARLCVLIEDITERRNLDEEIAQSRKLRAVGELVGGIAHEFNNLLTPIMLKVGEIQLNWRHDQRLVSETRLISEAVQRSAELTRRLLTFGRKADSRLEEVHLGTLINNCFSLLRLTVERRIRWEQDVPAGLPPIYFSPTNLNQIILNLLINARDTLLDKLAAQRGEWNPLIRVEVRLLPAAAIGHLDGTPSLRQILGWQRLTVRDNGLGITAEVRERIFEPFFTTKDVGKGTGLGLATVWHLVTEVSGRIEVESVPGEGTAFHVYLPMLPAPDAPATAAPAAPPAPAGRHARIFLAEDDELVAVSVTLALEHAGHKVVRLPDGAEAWQHLQTNLADYQLLIFDVNMPGLDGIELAQRVRTTSQYTGPILITSGRLGSDDLKQLAEARVDRVLNKPFAVAELLDAVDRCLTERPRA